jgi:hypothetical protein
MDGRLAWKNEALSSPDTDWSGERTKRLMTKTLLTVEYSAFTRSDDPLFQSGFKAHGGLARTTEASLGITNRIINWFRPHI